MEKAGVVTVNTPKTSTVMGRIDRCVLCSLTKSTSYRAADTFGSMLEKAF